MAMTNVTLNTILQQFRDDARNNRDLGDRFERMIQQFLRVDSLYAALFSEVWLWNEWPGKGAVGDVGIDLVAQTAATGEYWAIQCKFYLPEHTLSKDDLDSFFAALGKPQFTKGIIGGRKGDESNIRAMGFPTNGGRGAGLVQARLERFGALVA